MPAIEVSHVTKEYQLGALQSLKQKLVNTGARLMGREVEQTPLFKALDDVNFSIEPGEVVGIIGHNGAGKSTLLKMLARISTPTSGHVKVNGRVAPLIEVGAGFVGDFTGRENVYLNGAILGMSKREIDRKFDEIVDFAEMAEFIDTPVKRYSSGMQVKLAFAVATSIEAEILIVDEVLAVGDLAFQRKCFDRMENLIKREQRTVLMVSHNIRQVERLCHRVFMLDRGRVAHQGNPKAVCNAFFDYNDKKIYEQSKQFLLASGQRPVVSSGELDLEEIRLLDKTGAAVDRLAHLAAMVIELHVTVKSPLRKVAIGIGIHTPDMIYVANDDSSLCGREPVDLELGKHVIRYSVPALTLLPGIFSLRVGVAPTDTDRVVFYGENLKAFQVTADDISHSRTVNQGFVSFGGSWLFDRAVTASSSFV